MHLTWDSISAALRGLEVGQQTTLFGVLVWRRDSKLWSVNKQPPEMLFVAMDQLGHAARSEQK
jgi:hypothetical protein